MLHARLVRHPRAPWTGPDVSLAATLSLRADGGGECRFELAGPVAELLVPPRAAAARVAGLWKHTCFELFIGARGAAGYREFNFAPSGEWAAYEFADYRQALAPPALIAPSIRVETGGTRLVLVAEQPKGSWPGGTDLAVGLAAVVEARDGSLGYYALAHPAAHPDFHDRRGFVLVQRGARGATATHVGGER